MVFETFKEISEMETQLVATSQAVGERLLRGFGVNQIRILGLSQPLAVQFWASYLILIASVPLFRK